MCLFGLKSCQPCLMLNAQDTSLSLRRGGGSPQASCRSRSPDVRSKMLNGWSPFQHPWTLQCQPHRASTREKPWSLMGQALRLPVAIRSVPQPLGLTAPLSDALLARTLTRLGSLHQQLLRILRPRHFWLSTSHHNLNLRPQLSQAARGLYGNAQRTRRGIPGRSRHSHTVL